MDTQEEIEVQQIKRVDVILGRGAAAYTCMGNIAYRHVLWALRTNYKAAPWKKKADIGRKVVKEIHRQGGRFLVRNPKTKKYYEVSDEEAVIKACQAMREKKMEKPAGFDQNVMKVKSKAKWIKQVERTTRGDSVCDGSSKNTTSTSPMSFTPPPVFLNSSQNFKVSGMFSEPLLAALSGSVSNENALVSMLCIASEDLVKNQMKANGCNNRTKGAQDHSSTVTAIKFTAPVNEFSSHLQVMIPEEVQAQSRHEALSNNTDILRSLIPDPFISNSKGRMAPIKSRFDNSAQCLPAHVKSFFNGLLERQIPRDASKDQRDWINTVTQTTLDLKDRDCLENAELSVFPPNTWIDTANATAQRQLAPLHPTIRAESSPVHLQLRAVLNVPSSGVLESVLSSTISVKNRVWGEKGRHFSVNH